MQCVAVYCSRADVRECVPASSVLQFVTVCCSAFQWLAGELMFVFVYQFSVKSPYWVCSSVLQCVAVCCSLCVAVCCGVCSRVFSIFTRAQLSQTRHGTIILQHTATHCKTLQHIATYCNTLQHTQCPAKSNTSRNNTATHCNTLQHTATHCSTLQHTAAH